MKEIAANGILYFEDLPLMFKPGTIFFTIMEGQPQLLSLRASRSIFHAKCQNYFDLECTYVDWRGTRFGREDFHADSLVIYEFEGPMKITDLGIYPLVFNPSRREVEQELISRGKKVEAHKGYYHCAYDGIGVDEFGATGPRFDPDDGTLVEGRVIVDTEAFYKLHPTARSA